MESGRSVGWKRCITDTFWTKGTLSVFLLFILFLLLVRYFFDRRANIWSTIWLVGGLWKSWLLESTSLKSSGKTYISGFLVLLLFLLLGNSFTHNTILTARWSPGSWVLLFLVLLLLNLRVIFFFLLLEILFSWKKLNKNIKKIILTDFELDLVLFLCFLFFLDFLDLEWWCVQTSSLSLINSSQTFWTEVYSRS